MEVTTATPLTQHVEVGGGSSTGLSRLPSTRELYLPAWYNWTWDGSKDGELFSGASYVSTDTNLTVEDGPTSYDNLIALYGTVPRVIGATTDRPIFSPDELGDEVPAVTLSYNLNTTADVTVELIRLDPGASTSIDSWQMTGQIAGAQDLVWSGMLNDGARVPPGEYQWRITASVDGHESIPATVLMKVVY